MSQNIKKSRGIQDFKPKSSEKSQKSWFQHIEDRKKYDRNPKLIKYEDKIQAKKIAKSLGIKVPKNYYVTNKPGTIPFKKLPDKYVIKPNHLAGSKSVLLIKDNRNLITGKNMSTKEIIRIQNAAIRRKQSIKKGEWATQKIQPKVMVEELLPNLSGKWDVINDFKCYTFHGRVCLVKVDHHRNLEDSRTDYYTRDFTMITYEKVCQRDNINFVPMPKPKYWKEMIKGAEKIGKQFGKFIRIDFYITPNGAYFGECAIYPGSGKGTKFTPWVDYYLGAIWENPELVNNAFSKDIALKFKEKYKLKNLNSLSN